MANTPNYNLKKVEYTEIADIPGHFNANFDKIDEELKERDTRVGPLASLLTTIKTSIVNAINSLKGEVDAHKAETASKHITESGTNENGSYIKFDDGTMICNGLVSLTYDNEKRLRATWTYPATFTSQPAISVIYKHASTFTPTNYQIGQLYLSGLSDNTTAIIYVPRIEGMTDFQSEDTMIAYSIAIGRWK